MDRHGLHLRQSFYYVTKNTQYKSPTFQSQSQQRSWYESCINEERKKVYILLETKTQTSSSQGSWVWILTGLQTAQVAFHCWQRHTSPPVWCEARLLALFTVKIKNGWSCTSIPFNVLQARCSPDHRANFYLKQDTLKLNFEHRPCMLFTKFVLRNSVMV